MPSSVGGSKEKQSSACKRAKEDCSLWCKELWDWLVQMVGTHPVKLGGNGELASYTSCSG